MKLTRSLLFGLTSLLLIGTMATAQSLIIVNNAVNQATLTKEDVQLIFLGKKKKWHDGQRIRVAALKRGAVNEDFLSEYIKKTPSKYSSFWKIAIVSGTGHPPKFFDSEEELIDYVSKEDGAIGYISPKTNYEKVKTVTIK